MQEKQSRDRRKYLKKYIGWGVTIVVVSLLVLILFFCFFRFQALKSGIASLIGILMPVIYGLVIAYLMSPIYEWLRKRLRALFQKKLGWNGRKMEITVTVLSMLLAFACILAIVFGLLAMVVPRLITSITDIAVNFQSTINTLSQSMQELFSGLFGGNTEMEESAMNTYEQAITYVQNWLQNDIMPQMQQMFSYFTDIMLNALTFLKNLSVGMIVAIYLLLNKKKFISQGKKLLYAVFDVKAGNFIMENLRFANEAFGGFLIGSVIDSIIVGIVTGIALAIMNTPYPLIMAVFVGVTNIIPYFGPFIGAIPCTILIFIVDPLKALYFIIFILAWQQIDGNIIAPKILGNATGVSSFWVLFSIILFGGLFGVVGMVIGVPLFAVISHLLSDLVARTLRKKELPVTSTAYAGLDYIDEETREIIRVQEPAREPVVVNEKEIDAKTNTQPESDEAEGK